MVSLSDWKATKLQRKLVQKVLKSGRLTYGPMTRQFEEEFARIHGKKYAIFTSSGTDALKLGLHALKDHYGWQDGDEVIIPAVTFIASLNVVLMNNLVPVLVDVNEYDAGMNAKKVERAITKKTRAIMPVHLFGQTCGDMEDILKIAKKHKLKVIEDSCETMFMGASLGDVACYSTYVSHLLITGVGGFITTDNNILATTMRSLMFHGRDEAYLSIDDNHKTGKALKKVVERRFLFTRHGYSDRATEMEAALGLGDLANHKKMLEKRMSNGSILELGLRHLPQISCPIYKYEHAFMFFPLYVEQRDELMLYLEKKGIQTRTMMPLTNQPIVKPFLKKKYPVAEWINEHGLLLGCHPYLTKKDLDFVIKSVKEFYADSNTG